MPLGKDLTRLREEISGRLTTGERVVVGVWLVVILFLPFTGLALVAAGTGTTRTVGGIVLVIALLAYVTPISPFLRRRIARREEHET